MAYQNYSLQEQKKGYDVTNFGTKEWISLTKQIIEQKQKLRNS